MVSVLAVILAVAVPAFVRRLRVGKMSEAATLLEELHRKTAAYYETPQGPSKRMHCLPISAGPAPVKPSSRRQSVDFFASSTPGAATWKSVGFNPSEPIRYRYTMEVRHEGCDLRSIADEALVTFRAEGDLDGDGRLSLFERSAKIDAKGNLVPTGALYIQEYTE